MAEIEKTGKDNQETYSGFLKLTMWLIVLVVIVLIGMVSFLYHAPTP
ncbi:aa3-type cytochrome c oxidase subunit IV [Sandaracinobacteroides saxicola]|uniref:Aa3-type cytochrome c oxidase subunit IV n=1 Tax=Sandaracinobacteroides saxicola TaxID=2759707 RepID=A0A7G5IF90_9SPHN|nr:aa3-type cytochrome c oxidase subunit IV [Sandaracinobacteroides saxicola]QMW22032.1 aa3-type cytochrome c oxidase subunit IV [Sandaracinobacteroides saxicola]